jgi:hypothetical protein
MGRDKSKGRTKEKVEVGRITKGKYIKGNKNKTRWRSKVVRRNDKNFNRVSRERYEGIRRKTFNWSIREEAKRRTNIEKWKWNKTKRESRRNIIDKARKGREEK